MIKAIIIDDEQHCIDRLQMLVGKYCSKKIELAGAFQTAEEGLAAIKQLSPRLVFLDVEIKDKTGFWILQELPEIDFEVIFTTAFDRYAVQAFRFSAIDFLLKPVNPEELIISIDKLSEKISRNDLAQKFDSLFYNLKNIQTASKKICVPVLNGYVFLQTSEIIRCESEGNYTTLFLKDNTKLLVSKTLKEFEEMLGDYNFYRIHHSHLINLAFVKAYHKGKGGYVILSDGSEIEVSTRRKDDFIKRINTV